MWRWREVESRRREETTETRESLRKGLKPDDVLAVVVARGQVALEDYLRLRVRFFADGAVLGTRRTSERPS